jgi:hypothetical protein
MAKKRPQKWMQAVRERSERKGTVGAFGKATASKIAKGKAKGGKAKKRAVLAETFKRFAKNRKKSRS